MPDDITWLGEGELYGKPVVKGGCEFTCGTKQIWKVGVTPPIKTQGLTKKEIYKQIKPLQNQIVIQHIAKDSSGGTCTGGYHTDMESTHKFQVGYKQTYKGKRTIKDSQYYVVGGTSIFLPIISPGNYSFSFKTNEWGEDCIKPKGTDYFKMYVYSPDEEDNADIDLEIMLDDLEDDEEELDNDLDVDNTYYYKYGLSILAASGVILTISSLYKKN